MKKMAMSLLLFCLVWAAAKATDLVNLPTSTYVAGINNSGNHVQNATYQQKDKNKDKHGKKHHKHGHKHKHKHKS